MKVYVAVTVANEIDGRTTIVRADKASTNRVKVEEWLRTRQATWREQIRPGPAPQQGMNVGLQPTASVADCLCQINIIEVEVEVEDI